MSALESADWYDHAVLDDAFLSLAEPDDPFDPELDGPSGGMPDARDALDASPEPRTGADLLDQVHAFGCRFIAWPDAESAIAWTTWIAHTYLLDQCDSTPRLAVISPEKQSGKTRLLEVSETLIPRPMRSASTTTAVLFRLIGTENRPTVLLDEADAVWSEKGANEELRALINAGHRRGSDVHRMTGDGSNMRATSFASFAAVALAGIGDLPDTVMDRSVVLRMRRRSSHEHIERWRFRQGQEEGGVLARKLATWAATVTELPLPEDVDDIVDRAMDVWEPLFAVADAAGGRWPAAARDACRVLSAANPADTSLRLRLLAELRDTWPAGEIFDATSDLLARLHGLEDSPWAPGGPFGENGLTPHTLARLLSNYGIRSKHSPDKTHRGYHHHDLVDPWDRYLGPSPARVEVYPPTVSETPPADAPLGSGEASKASGASRPPTECTTCGEPLHEALVTAGTTTHPGCSLPEDQP
ncbi:MAG: DUF3631 domain-containing protein [Actinomycetes bacterium]